MPKIATEVLSEIVPNVAYRQPHSIRKYPNQFQDNFENPYGRVPWAPPPQQQQMPPYPQQQQPGYPGYPFGRKKRRSKRGADATAGYDSHWGMHRIMSTGM